MPLSGMLLKSPRGKAVVVGALQHHTRGDGDRIARLDREARRTAVRIDGRDIAGARCARWRTAGKQLAPPTPGSVHQLRLKYPAS